MICATDESGNENRYKPLKPAAMTVGRQPRLKQLINPTSKPDDAIVSNYCQNIAREIFF
jgi:hypothetical protein